MVNFPEFGKGVMRLRTSMRLMMPIPAVQRIPDDGVEAGTVSHPDKDKRSCTKAKLTAYVILDPVRLSDGDCETAGDGRDGDDKDGREKVDSRVLQAVASQVSQLQGGAKDSERLTVGPVPRTAWKKTGR